MRHIIEDVFFPTKTNKVLFYQFGQLFSSKKGQMGLNEGQKGQISYLKEVVGATHY